MKYYLIIGERSKGRKRMMKIRSAYDDFVDVFLKNNDPGMYKKIKEVKGMDFFLFNLLFAWEWYKHQLKEEVDLL